MKLYHFKVSPPSRCALMTVRNLDLDIEVKIVDFPGREHFSEEFLKINPLHTIPVLVDDDLILTESRAIACYLCNLTPGCSLYPSDPKARALVDLRLYYDATVVYPSWYNNAVNALIYKGATTISQDARDKIQEMLNTLERLLGENTYFAGETITLADISILSSIGVLSHAGTDLTKYPRISAWYEKCKTLKGWEENDDGAKYFGDVIKSKLQESWSI